MDLTTTRSYGIIHPYLISVSLVIVTAIFCYFSLGFIGYRAVALILLLVVSVNAILFDIFPVMLSALLSALIWNFFFIPPILTWQIDTPEDALLFLMYFVIALINAVLTYKIREAERKRREEAEKAKAIQLYNTLLNSLSHELRTPIATIIGAIDTIKDNQTVLSESDRDELYSEIEIAGFRLDRQVGNLLNMGRLEAGFVQVKGDWCDVNELIFGAIKDNADEAKHHTINFEPNEDLPLCKLDGGLMEHILYNLVHNAVRHTPVGTAIQIGVNHTATHCVVHVADNGKGFPEDKIDLVFGKFYRVDNTATGGTGLGLSIVKGFTEAMGGTVSVANQPMGGALFTIEIPCAFAENTHLEHE